jgi:hypothetical protein
LSDESLDVVASLPGCGAGGDEPNGRPEERIEGQSSFESAPPITNQNGGARAGAEARARRRPLPPTRASAPTRRRRRRRIVEETDLYRLEGDRLYYLNGTEV